MYVIIEFSVIYQEDRKNTIYKPKYHFFNHYHDFGKNIIYQPELSNIIFYIPRTNNYTSIICRTIWNKLIRANNYKNAINEMKNNNVLLLLFNDYRLKKCEKLYDDYDWNITFWKYCFKTVNEIEKKKQKKNNKNKKWYEWKLIQNPLSSNQYALFTIIFVTISLLAILYQVFFVENDDANAKFNK